MGFLDSFTGKSARKDIDKGIAAVSKGRDDAIATYRAAGTEAKGYLEPYREGGEKGFNLYNDTLGVNGTGARDAAQGTYLSDDILQKQLALQQRNRGWASNARGAYATGADALAASRINLQGYGDWQNRLAGVGQQGQQAATTTAGIAQNEGAGVAGAYQNATGQTAGLYGQRAQTQNTLAQNLIGLGGVAVSAFNPAGSMAKFGVNKLSVDAFGNPTR